MISWSIVLINCIPIRIVTVAPVNIHVPRIAITHFIFLLTDVFFVLRLSSSPLAAVYNVVMVMW